MLKNVEDEVSAHLSAHRFLLEIILAQAFSTMEPAAVDAWVKQVKRVSRLTWSREAPEDASASLAVAQRSSTILGQILDLAVERAEEAREGKR